MYKVLFVSMAILLSTACSDNNSADSANDEEFSVATVRSTDLNYINIDTKLNGWLMSQVGSERLQIMLKLREDLTGNFDDPAEWALAIRTQPRPTGSMLAEDLEIKLFSNYTVNNEICCTNSRPFSDFDIADASYLGVSGFINFESADSGTFEVGFQRETEVGSGITTGQIVTVEGCWLIGGEGGSSGCEI